MKKLLLVLTLLASVSSFAGDMDCKFSPFFPEYQTKEIVQNSLTQLGQIGPDAVKARISLLGDGDLKITIFEGRKTLAVVKGNPSLDQSVKAITSKGIEVEASCLGTKG